jgi:hypothetical protein
MPAWELPLITLPFALGGLGAIVRRVTEAVLAAVATPVSTITSPPATPADAPTTIRISPELNKDMNRLWGDSLPGGKAHERGGTLAFDTATGELVMVNEGGNGSTSGTFSPNLTVNTSTHTMAGVFHTHPYDASEGAMENVPFSAGDVSGMINDGTHIEVVQSGDTQFMLVQTGATPTSVSAATVQAEFDTAFDKARDAGASFEEANQAATKELAEKYNFAYYEGRNGTFNRVSP